MGYFHQCTIQSCSQYNKISPFQILLTILDSASPGIVHAKVGSQQKVMLQYDYQNYYHLVDYLVKDSSTCILTLDLL